MTKMIKITATTRVMNLEEGQTYEFADSALIRGIIANGYAVLVHDGGVETEMVPDVSRETVEPKTVNERVERIKKLAGG